MKTSKATGRLIRDGLLREEANQFRLAVSRHPISDRALTLVLDGPADFFRAEPGFSGDHWSLHFHSHQFADSFYFYNFPRIEQQQGYLTRRLLLTVEFEQPLSGELAVVLIVAGKPFARARMNTDVLKKRDLIFELTEASTSAEGVSGAGRNFSITPQKFTANDLKVHSYLFISGTHKSGTTWLENILNADPRVLVLHEGNTLSFLRPQQLASDCVARSSELRHVPWFPASVSVDMVRVFVHSAVQRQILDYYGTRWGAQVVGDRTPGMTPGLHEIFRAFDATKALHICRHPLDVATSWVFHEFNLMQNGASTDTHLDAAVTDRVRQFVSGQNSGNLLFGADHVESGAFDWIIHQWVNDQEAALRLKAEFPDRVHLVSYESLLNNPKKLIESFFDFAGLGLADEELRTIVERSDFRRYSGGRPRGEKDSSSFFRSGTTGDYKHHFDVEACRAMFAKLSTTARKFGYESDM